MPPITKVVDHADLEGMASEDFRRFSMSTWLPLFK